MAVKNFEDLNVWKQARQLTQEVYRLTKTEKFLKDFGLRDQIDGQRSQSCPCEIAMYYVYVLKSRKDGRFYVGCTADLRKRVAEHNNGKVRSTCHRIPFDLLYYEASWNHTDALHREKYLKTTYGKRYLKN